MKYAIAVISGVMILWLLIVSCSADVYVLVDKDGNVLSAIEKDVAVVGTGMTKVVLPGSLKEYGLTLQPTYYKLVDKTFIQNNAKISAEAVEKETSSTRAAEISMVEKRAQKLACEQLVAEGVKFEVIKCEEFEK